MHHVQARVDTRWSWRRYRLVGLVLRPSPRERKIPGSNPACTGIFLGSSHTSDSKIGTQVATLQGAGRYRVSAWTGRPDVSILWLGEVESLICNLYLSVAARKIEQIRPWDALACCWDVKHPTNNLKEVACVAGIFSGLDRMPVCFRVVLSSPIAFCTIFVPKLTYQCQTWTMIKPLERKFTTCERRCLRKAVNKTKRDMIPNTKIRKVVATKSIHHIQQQRIKWFGHITRLPIKHPVQRACIRV